MLQPRSRSFLTRSSAGGLVLAALAAFLIFSGRGLRLGSPGEMGPGFFPQLLNGLLLLLGVAIFLPGFREPDAAPLKIHWPTAVIVLAVPIVFAVLVKPAGLVLTNGVVTFAMSSLLA